MLEVIHLLIRIAQCRSPRHEIDIEPDRVQRAAQMREAPVHIAHSEIAS